MPNLKFRDTYHQHPIPFRWLAHESQGVRRRHRGTAVEVSKDLNGAVANIPVESSDYDTTLSHTAVP